MELNTVLKAISNETRLKILQWLKNPSQNFTSPHCDVDKDGVCVGLIEQKAGLSQSTTSQYLMILQQAGLIITERRGQWTFCKRNEVVIQEFTNKLAKDL